MFIDTKIISILIINTMSVVNRNEISIYIPFLCWGNFIKEDQKSQENFQHLLALEVEQKLFHLASFFHVL